MIDKRKKLIAWAIVIGLGLPFLFWLFEFVVPNLLPENF